MIEKRHQARIEKNGAFPRHPDIQSRTEFDLRNADAALLLLGIATSEKVETVDSLKLNFWAVQAALPRWRSRPKPKPDKMSSIRSGTRDGDKLRWPGDGTMNEKVGYRMPPSSKRFRKGNSGNLAGRPKGQRHELPHETLLGQLVTI
jgi:hypothetical protein